jgi:TRAP-type C4-dicarboxylate transport system permease small subunit
MHTVAKVTPFGMMLLPVMVLAADPDLGFFASLVAQIQNIVNILIPLVIAIGLLFFIWGLVQYIAASGDEAAKEEGKRKMIWGVIALFVIVTVWGLVALLNQLTGVDQGGAVVTPIVPGA